MNERESIIKVITNFSRRELLVRYLYVSKYVAGVVALPVRCRRNQKQEKKDEDEEEKEKGKE